MNFDLTLHFKKFANNLFYNQKSYSDFQADINSFTAVLRNLTNECHIGLKIQSPYYAMVALVACLINNKLAIMISHLETEVMIEKLKKQIQFDYIIDDTYFEKLTPQQNDIFPDIEFNKIFLAVFSSGSTSTPKGIALSFKNLYFSALGFSEFFHQGQNETSLINLPHHHVGGLMTLWRAFFSGGKIVSDFFESVDFISLVPLQLKRLLEDATKIEKLKKIRVILIGGSALTSSLKNEAQIHGIILYETYGMSETTSLIMINGEVLPYRDLKLDESGFFNVKGETLAAGYFQNRIFIPFKDEWFKTNDIGEITITGKFQFKERADLIFISGGENINPLIVEEVAKLHSDVLDAYLIPIPDEEWGEMGILLYSLREPSKDSENKISDQLKNYLKSSLHPHLVPKYFFCTNLSLAGQLKPKRSELKNLALELYLKSFFSFTFIKHSNPSAPVLVLFHGFMGDKDDLLKISNTALAEYSILSIDLPGHGNTKIENFHSLNDILQKLSKFIKLFSSSPTYYGYSMGGRIALMLALQYLRPSKLILESAGVGLCDQNEKIERFKIDETLFDGVNQSNLMDFFKRWYSNPMFKSYLNLSSFQQDCDKKCAHDFLQWKKSQKFLSTGAFPIANWTIAEMLNSGLSIIYIYGQEDEKYKSIGMKLSTLNLPNIQVFEITGAGHNPHKTHPMEITPILIKTLK